MPVTISPTRSAYSSYMIERSASWMRWRSTCLAVWPAIRLNPSGVTATIWAGENQSHSSWGSGSSSGCSPSGSGGAGSSSSTGSAGRWCGCCSRYASHASGVTDQTV